MNIILVITIFLLVHVLFDFYFQPSKWVESKTTEGFKSKYLYWHCFIYALAVSGTVFILTSVCWLTIVAFVAVGISHVITDGLKKKYKDAIAYFFIDQFLHLFVLEIIVWIVCTKQIIEVDKKWVIFLIYVLGYLIALKPFGLTAKNIMDTFDFNPEEKGLKDGGLWIGYIERFLILTFVLMSYYEGIGFLLAAKSIFRFGELKNENEIKRTEYILIGTLLSFGLAVCVGMLMKVTLNYL
ncbi:MAG: DUF3307 domain-containing protein [Bacteroidales bacterium]|nr:DUF3307 domain-containing protein [Bacteroidales bacterium]